MQVGKLSIATERPSVVNSASRKTEHPPFSKLSMMYLVLDSPSNRSQSSVQHSLHELQVAACSGPSPQPHACLTALSVAFCAPTFLIFFQIFQRSSFSHLVPSTGLSLWTLCHFWLLGGCCAVVSRSDRVFLWNTLVFLGSIYCR